MASPLYSVLMDTKGRPARILEPRTPHRPLNTCDARDAQCWIPLTSLQALPRAPSLLWPSPVNSGLPDPRPWHNRILARILSWLWFSLDRRTRTGAELSRKPHVERHTKVAKAFPGTDARFWRHAVRAVPGRTRWLMLAVVPWVSGVRRTSTNSWAAKWYRRTSRRERRACLASIVYPAFAVSEGIEYRRLGFYVPWSTSQLRVR